jgi:hypothetical protein
MELPNFELSVPEGNDPVEQISQLFDCINEQIGADVDAPLPQPVLDTLINSFANEDYGLLAVMEQNERYSED